jgi:hypothetical protein
LNRAYFQASTAAFLKASDDEILGQMTAAHGFALDMLQRNAWIEQFAVLKSSLAGLTPGTLFLEFAIPRMGKRADALLLIDNKVIVFEFKVGTNHFERNALDQVEDYALDLKNFHLGSHKAIVIPVLIATAAPTPESQTLLFSADNVASPVLANASSLPILLKQLITSRPGSEISVEDWLSAGYRPTPTIVEAARALYEQHTVEEITRSDAGAKNLSDTATAIQKIIDQAKDTKTKAICFITGVPGAGKTLAGLNVATKRTLEHLEDHAVFLSGNGPLVAVLQEALARDKAERDGISKKDALREVKSFVQPIHHFRDEYLRDLNAPDEKVVIFDEAQRAWTKDKAVKFMRERGNKEFDTSEPDFLISVMDRHPDWCVVICLVGGGQEINTGEAGLGEWAAALADKYKDWKIFSSDRLSEPEYTALSEDAEKLRETATSIADLHLSVSIRSFRAETLSQFVSCVLENEPGTAARLYKEIADRYPIAVTRDLSTARGWVRSHARGSERYGLLASSGARRLRPEGVEVRQKIDPAAWFLNDRSDVRSSYYCEETATEFDVQGLELDWAAIGWDADLRYAKDAWHYWDFKGSRWQQVKALEPRVYLKNAYRVLLTRARQGMVIFVPTGNDTDPTRPSSYYDPTYEYLLRCGLPTL